MFSINECTVISWSCNRDIYAVAMKDNDDRFAITSAAEHAVVEGERFGEAIQKCYSELAQPKDSLVILTGHVEQGVYLELKLPNLKDSELGQLLRFELTRRIPFDIEDMVWTHEVVDNSLDETTGKVSVRVFAVPARRWGQVVSELQLSGIKADIFMPAFMSANSEGEYFFPTINRNFSMSATNDHKLREFILSLNPGGGLPDISGLIEENEYAEQVKAPRFIPAVMCGAHALRKGINRNTNLMSLPKDMTPMRFQFLSRLFFALVALTVVVWGAFAGRIYWETVSRMDALKEEREIVESKIARLKHIATSKEALDKTIEIVQNSYVGEPHQLEMIADLTNILPNEMRLTSYSLRDGRIDLNILMPRYNYSVIQKIQRNPRFDAGAPGKRSSRLGVTVSLKLEIKE